MLCKLSVATSKSDQQRSNNATLRPLCCCPREGLATPMTAHSGGTGSPAPQVRSDSDSDIYSVARAALSDTNYATLVVHDRSTTPSADLIEHQLRRRTPHVAAESQTWE